MIESPAALAVRRLAAGDRAAILAHLLALNPDDRYGRFASALSDQAIASHVVRIALNRDLAFGIGENSGRLSAFIHLATGHPAALRIAHGLGYTVDIRPTSPCATICVTSTKQ